MAEPSEQSFKPLKYEEIYAKLLQYTLKKEELKKLGFPYESSSGKVKSKVIFQNSANPAEQVCRCGMKISLLEPNWFFDSKGCLYHPGKRVYEGPTAGQFDCCRRVSDSKGCTFSNYHVASFHPVENGFVKTKSKPFRNISPSCNIFALDCEMVYTVKGLEVARVSVVSLGRKIVFDTFVRPRNKILDFNTPFSGISFSDLQNVFVTLKDVQKVLLDLMDSGTILIGHGLENDLLGLNLIHENVIDTSFVFPHENGFPFRQSLKALALKHLGKQITNHDSIQDAETCMELVLLKIFSKGEKIPSCQLCTAMCSNNSSLPKYCVVPLTRNAPLYFPTTFLTRYHFLEYVQKSEFKTKVPQNPTSFTHYQHWSMLGIEFLPCTVIPFKFQKP